MATIASERFHYTLYWYDTAADCRWWSSNENKKVMNEGDNTWYTVNSGWEYHVKCAATMHVTNSLQYSTSVQQSNVTAYTYLKLNGQLNGFV